ncbi:MAG TPA: T9SS type A sorting domain-containing protein [Chitinophagales bacterium]|nr:T9SS type A sorting domain-containing protein [Chitinophagales bacterium]
MKPFFPFLFFLVTYTITSAQNLVLNGSFENYSACPNNYSQLDSALYWTTPTAFSSSDYYHACADPSTFVSVPLNGPGYQEANSGEAYAGIYLVFPGSLNYREYLEVQLADTLIKDACYIFQMYVNLTNTCKFTTDAVGAYFSDTAIINLTTFNPLPVIPQISNSNGNFLDTLEWTLVSATYQASGGESHLIIGNFVDDAATALAVINNAAPFDFVYALVDDVSLIPCKATGDEAFKKFIAHIYPNPATDWLSVEINNEMSAMLKLYDMSNRVVLQKSFNRGLTLSTIGLPKGIYVCEIIQLNATLIKKLIIY